jgi:diguanylate cyclase (GGDEF)-like protein
MRESDTVARVGGDEFVALFPRLDSAADLATVAASISGCIDVPIQIRGHQITVTTSVGLAVYREGEATDELITRADHAMYRAKQDGVSGWEEYLFELTEAAVGPA